MIQRIQSLWLLLASLSVCLLFFFPVANFVPDLESANAHAVIFDFYAHNIKYAAESMESNLYAPLAKYTVIAVVLVCILTPFISIFMHKNRPRQVQLSRLTVLLNAVLLVAFFLLSDSFAEKSHTLVSYGVGVYVPIIPIACLLLAVRFIRKDDKLVRSADRIR